MRSARAALWLCLSGLSVLAYGCSKAHFSGQAPATKVDPPEPVTQSYEMTCLGGVLQQDVTLEPGTLTTATIKGELCPVAAGAATVLFLVDYSGSMGKHRPTPGGATGPGNDPQANQSCGRLEAAKAVLGQLAQAGNADVKVGFVPFAGRVVSERVIGLTSLNQFQASLTEATFCSYVIQDSSFGLNPKNPGGIQSQYANSSTNYAAAFGAAEQMLGSEEGHKVVYFVSDGQPTSGGNDPAQAGIDAGESLRANVPDLTVNGLLLGADGAQALEVLQQVVGDEARVRLAAKASELASEIVKFRGLELTEATADLQRDRQNPQALALTSFEKTADSSVWSFQTSAFELQAAPGATVAHRVTVAAKTTDGQSVQVSALLNVKQM